MICLKKAIRRIFKCVLFGFCYLYACFIICFVSSLFVSNKKAFEHRMLKGEKKTIQVTTS